MDAPLVNLRPVEADDLAWLAEMTCDRRLVGDHNWAGEPRDFDEVLAESRERFEGDGLLGEATGSLIIEHVDGTRIGEVSWRSTQWGPSAKSRCPEFGIALRPEFRGRGYGTTAQKLLIDYLFTRDPDLHRVQSDTAADNGPEQGALSKAGMTVEGVVRNAEYRDGTYHDHVLFSILRDEWQAGRG